MITSEYLDQIKKVHDNQLWGASGYSHAPVVVDYMRELGAETILDYGCGRATLRAALQEQGINAESIFEYDPAIPGKDEMTGRADLVVSTDVLEHIEPQYLYPTIAGLRYLAIKGAYFTIALTPSKVFLPDGRNAHLILKSREWWLDQLRNCGFSIYREELRKGLWVWAK